jgi:hypothetical protein
MAKGSEIILTNNPKGIFDEGIISGTPKPGTCVEIVPTTAPVGGRFTYRAVTRANGAKGPVCVLLPDRLQGKLATDAYVTATRCFLYWPIAGEELNMLLRETVGTGTAGETNIGDLLAIESATGELMAGGALASQPFWLMEHLGVTSADQLVFVKYLGNQA